MKDIRISVRVPKEIKERLEQAEKITGIDEATLVRNCVLALLDEIEESGQITFPLQVVPKKKEPSPRYKVKASAIALNDAPQKVGSKRDTRGIEKKEEN